MAAEVLGRDDDRNPRYFYGTGKVNPKKDFWSTNEGKVVKRNWSSIQHKLIDAFNSKSEDLVKLVHDVLEERKELKAARREGRRVAQVGRLKTLAAAACTPTPTEPETRVITDEHARTRSCGHAPAADAPRAPARGLRARDRDRRVSAGPQAVRRPHDRPARQRRPAHDARARAGPRLRVPGPHEPVSRGASPFSASSRRASSVFSSDSPIPASTPVGLGELDLAVVDDLDDVAPRVAHPQVAVGLHARPRPSPPAPPRGRRPRARSGARRRAPGCGPPTARGTGRPGR